MGQQNNNIEYTDPWTVLGVHRGSSRDEIKAAFRKAALAHHPDVDKSPQAAARFTQVKAAADVLLKGVGGCCGAVGPLYSAQLARGMA